MTSRLLPSKLRYLVPSRTTPELYLNAWKGCLSLLSESKSRDQFWDYTKDGIIRKDSSSSLVMGQVLMASLWDELEQSQQYGFKPYEFLEGVTPALGQFHDVQRKFDQKIFQVLHGKSDLKTDDDLSISIGNDTSSVDQKEDKKDISSLREEDFQRMMGTLEDFQFMVEMNNPDSNWKSKLDSIYQWDWNDTIVHDFQQTVSPEFFKSYQLERIVQTLMSGKNPNSFVKKTEVDNSMILSARVSLLEDNNKDNNINNVNISSNEDTLEMAFREDEKLTVAIRVDVLYDLYRTFIIPKQPRNLILDEKDGDDDDDDDGTLSNQNNKQTELVCGDRCHGVFEGFLTGRDDGLLRWRISNVDFLHMIDV